jgi:WD40 repeat protein
MGQVFLGRSPAGRKVAIKVINPDWAAAPKFRERFAREIEAARRVGGFHAAQVVDADPNAPSPWMVTAYIEGPTLAEQVQRSGPLPAGRIRELGAQLAEGLAAIHDVGLVHRDLKPSNVILAADGPRIIDFGIARSAHGAGLTSVGTVIGTVAYMSPEQDRGESARPASDVFALGAVLAFAATGRAPSGTGAAGLDGVTDAALRAVIAACRAQAADQRPALATIIADLAADGGADHRSAGYSSADQSWADYASADQTSADHASGDHARADQARADQGWGDQGWGDQAGRGRADDGTRVDLRPADLGAGGLSGPGGLSAIGLAGDGRAAAPGSDRGDTPADGTGFVPPPPGPDGPDYRYAPAGFPVPGGSTAAHASSGQGSPPPSGGVSPTTSARRPAPRRRTLLLAGIGTAVVAAVGIPVGLELSKGGNDGTAASGPASGSAASGGAGSTASATDDGATGPAPAGAPNTERVLQHGTNGGAQAVAFSPDAHTLASGNGNGTTTLWVVKTGKLITTLNHGASAAAIGGVAFSPDSKTLAVASGDGTTRLFNPATGKVIDTLASPSAAASTANSVAFSPTGALLATSHGSTVTVWDTASRKAVATKGLASGAAAASLAFSADGRTLAVSDGAGKAEVWNVASRKLMSTLTGVATGPGTLAFGAQQQLATANADGTVALWDVGSGKKINTLTNAKSNAKSIAIRTNSSQLMSGNADGTGSVFSVTTGKVALSVDTKSGTTVPSVALCPGKPGLCCGGKNLVLWTHTAK